MTEILVFVLIDVICIDSLELYMYQDQWSYSFVYENHNSVSGSRMF